MGDFLGLEDSWEGETGWKRSEGEERDLGDGGPCGIDGTVQGLHVCPYVRRDDAVSTAAARPGP